LSGRGLPEHLAGGRGADQRLLGAAGAPGGVGHSAQGEAGGPDGRAGAAGGQVAGGGARHQGAGGGRRGAGRGRGGELGGPGRRCSSATGIRWRPSAPSTTTVASSAVSATARSEGWVAMHSSEAPRMAW